MQQKTTAQQIQLIASRSERGKSVFSCASISLAASLVGDSLINKATGKATIK